MKRAKISFVALFLSTILFSQDVIITDGQTINSCGGTFFDSGGSIDSYQPSEDITFTICPDNPGQQISTLDFTTFDVESGFEDFEIYDGVDINAPLIGIFSGSDLQGTMIVADLASATGCLTIHFLSDGSVQNTGWEAVIGCTYPCQDFSVNLSNVSPLPSGPNGEVVLCQGSSYNFSVEGIYPNNNTDYNQTDLNTQFSWSVGDSIYSGTNVSGSIADGGFYYASVIATDINGCQSDNSIGQFIIVGSTPVFEETVFQSDSTLCLGDTLTIVGGVESVEISQPLINVLAEEVFLPDGSGVSYSSNITFNSFTPGQTLTDLNDLVGICANMEHSYLGDLEISIMCPNGTVVVLKQTSGGGGTFLGEPIDDDANLGPGVGYDYCWEENASFGTLVDESANYSTLPAGSYSTVDPLSSLIGCPLNGDWSIEIADNMSSDNGFIFSWQIDFNPGIIPPPFVYDPGVVTEEWNSDVSIVGINNTSIQVSPDAIGTYDYTYSMTDSLGCSFDTTLTIEVFDVPVIDITGGEGCSPSSIQFTNNTIGDSSFIYSWYFGEGVIDSLTTAFEPTYEYQLPGDYNIIVQAETIDGCIEMESFPSSVLIYDQPVANFIITNSIIEILDPEVFFENQSSGATQFNWSFDSLGISSNEHESFIFDEIDCYDVQLVVANDDGCQDTTSESFCVQDLSTFYVPDAFTPDDNGLNETFGPIGVGNDFDNVEFLVFDRWGTLVFETKDMSRQWDGKASDGNYAPQGVYVWIARSIIPPVGKAPLLQMGHVTLFN